MCFYRVSQTLTGIDDIAIASTNLQARENAGVFQMSNDSKRRPLRNTHTLCDIAEPGVRVLRQANEYMPIVTEEIPIGIGVTHAAIIRHSIPDMYILMTILPELH